MRYSDFGVSGISASFSTKSITINTNFKVDETTLNKETVKLFKVNKISFNEYDVIINEKKRKSFNNYKMICNNKEYSFEHFDIVFENENQPIKDYNIACDGKDIIITLDEFPYENEKYYLFMDDVYDKLGRKLNEPFMKYIMFTPDIGTRLKISSPIDQVALKQKKVHIEVTILDDDNYTLKLIDNSEDSFDIVTFSKHGGFVEGIEIPGFPMDDLTIFNEANLEEVLSLSGSNSLRVEISTDNRFFRKESLVFDEHDAKSSNVYKLRAENIARIGNSLSFDAIVDHDDQFYIRARLESKEDPNIFGPWSDQECFIVKSESPVTSTDDYLDEMLFSDVIFQDELLELKEISKTDYSCTDQEFYIEFNKPVLILDDMEEDEDGLILIGKGYLIRRDL